MEGSNSKSYRPAKFIAIQKDAVSGDPDLDRASTSHVERRTRTLRQWCKRLTRLTYGSAANGTTSELHSPCTSRTITFVGFMVAFV